MAVLHVTGLPKSTTANALKSSFMKVGPVSTVRIIRNKFGHTLAGLVEMHDLDAEEIMNSKDTIQIGGKRPTIWRPLSLYERMQPYRNGRYTVTVNRQRFEFEKRDGHLRWCRRL